MSDSLFEKRCNFNIRISDLGSGFNIVASCSKLKVRSPGAVPYRLIDLSTHLRGVYPLGDLDVCESILAYIVYVLLILQ